MAQRRGSVPGVCAVALVVTFVASFAVVSVQGVDHAVGGSSGWSKPNGNTVAATYLQDWAKAQSFTAGDQLIFDYNPAAHNVLVVTLADYVICNALSPIAKYSTGKDIIKLAAGPSYHICGTPTHCESGQKFNLTAAASGSSSSSATARLAVPGLPPFVAAATLAAVATIALW